MKITLILAIAICTSIFAADTNRPAVPQTTNSFSIVLDDAFEAGLKLGYACAQRGGTKADIETILAAKRRGDVASVNRWFDTH